MAVDLALVAFGVGMAAATLVVATLLATVLADVRFWPPGERDWRFGLHWGLVAVFDLSYLVVSYLDWGTLSLPRPESVLVGTAPFVAGLAVGVRAGQQLRAAETVGLAGDLYTGGLYRYSRNPQYVGFAVAAVGWILLSASRLGAVMGLAFVCWQLLLPFVEEPWLAGQFGEEYREYRRSVPRFVGVDTLRAPLDR